MYRFILLLMGLLECKAYGQNLIVRAGSDYLTFLSYKNVTLFDKSRNIGQPFTTEGFYVIHKNGKREGFWSYQGASEKLADGSGWKYTYNFGTLLYKYNQVKDTLFFDLSITNTSQSDTLCGVNIIPLQLEFPKRPAGFDPQLPNIRYNLDGPSILPADYSSGKVVLTNEDVNNNYFIGWVYDVNARSMLYKIWLSSVPFYGMQTQGLPNLEKKLAPRQTAHYRLALRFYPTQTPDEQLAPTVMERYRAKNKNQLVWKDRRPIGALFLASDAKQDIKNNPRGFLPGIDGKTISINTTEGLQQLRRRVIEYAQRSITILKAMNSQGMVTWDIEGQQFGHPISYVGSPDKLKQVAPEMEPIADEYFSLFRKAGLRTGICIRPQDFVLSNNGESATQKDVIGTKAIANLLIKKVKYARSRWGCTLFYVDSNFGTDGAVLNPDIFKAVLEAVPDVLLIPEHENTKYFQYTAPFQEMRFGGRAVDDITHTAYPSSFYVLTTGEAFYDGKGKRVISDEELKSILKQGNIFMFRAWYPDEPTNSIIKKLYSEVYSGK